MIDAELIESNKQLGLSTKQSKAMIRWSKKLHYELLKQCPNTSDTDVAIKYMKNITYCVQAFQQAILPFLYNKIRCREIYDDFITNLKPAFQK